ncbi:hypothetical protein [Paenibacillus turpanensis]|uniref:hypothetical protein n=1 Tax=Paenibacillus turpanensis TaxID=2689078 RepID=UPI00140C84C8
MSNNADPNIANLYGDTALHLLASSYLSEDTSGVVELLIKSGVKKNLKNKNEERPFDLALKANNDQLFSLL